MAKSRDAFRTISEVSDWLDTPAHVLRFWESRFSQIKPVKRAGGRRYYRPNDMLLLGGIKQLLHDDGITIKGVQKILREKGLKYVSSLSHDLSSTGASDTDDIASQTPIEPIVQAVPEAPAMAEPVVAAVEDDNVEPIGKTSAPEEIAEQAAPSLEVAALEDPDVLAFEPSEEPEELAAIDTEQGIDIIEEISEIPVSDDRLIVLYHQLEALKNRVEAQMQAA